MNQTSQMLLSLKRCLKIRGITYRGVAEELGLSEPSVKRLFSEESFSLQRLERVCRMLDMSLFDLARMARVEEGRATVLSIEQEQAFADDSQLFATFYLLVNEWTLSAIKKRFRLDKPQLTALLLRLDELQLIDLEPKNKVRLRTSRSIQWRPDGPVRRTYGEEVKTSFMDSEFTGPEDALRLPTAELSEASVQLMHRKIDKLVREFNELAEADLSLPLDQRKGVGLLIGFRPWSFFEWIIG